MPPGSWEFTFGQFSWTSHLTGTLQVKLKFE